MKCRGSFRSPITVCRGFVLSPIINQPQCGISGVGKIEKRVCVVDDMIAIRPESLHISFTFDHRILDGASADNFVSALQSIIENWT